MKLRRPRFPALAVLLWLLSVASRTSGQVSAPAPAPVSSVEGPFGEEVFELDPFTGIQICLPYNVLIAPSAGNHSLTIASSLDVLAALSATVTDDILQLETDDDFITDQPIKLTVFVPNGELQSVLVTSPLSQVTLAPGFRLPSMTINNGYNAAQTIVLDIQARFLNIISSGTGGVYVNGSIANANVQAASSGTVYLLGLNGTLLLNLADAASIITHTIGGQATLSGTTTGTNAITYDEAACNILSPTSAGPVCDQNSTLRVPAAQPLWSCGMEVFGNFSCAGGSSFVSTIGDHLTIGQNRAAAAAGSNAGAVARSPGTSGASPINPFSFVFGNMQPFASPPGAAAAASTTPTPAASPPEAAAASSTEASPAASSPSPAAPFNPFQFVFGNSNPFATTPGATTDSVPSGPATATSTNGSPAIATSGVSGRRLLQGQQVSTSTDGPGSQASGFTSVPGAPPISSSQQDGNGSTQTVTSGPGTSPTAGPSVPATPSTPPGVSTSNQQVSTSTSGPGSSTFGSSSVPGASPVTSSQSNGNGRTTTVTQTIPQTFSNSNGGNVIVAPGAASAAATGGAVPGVASIGARLDALTCSLGSDDIRIEL
ncbi:hypothetical protein WJX74_004765 [Apatococcus lobatus]|uniref:Putative auto-transporter adhesin head GIN domain-containing protein n=1 Tax=Apatococcus lobatus TaxID=904363 RepID=A0AAW1REQ7_9CHLO